MNPIRIKTNIDKYRIHTIYMPSMFKWFTLASVDNNNLNTVEGMNEGEAFNNHLRISSFYLEKFQSEKEEILTEAIKEIIIASEEEAIKETETPQEEIKDDDTKEEI